MMITQTSLSGSIKYNPNFPPDGAKRGYVARIKGRAAGALKFDREFLGELANLVEGDEGLYERQIGEKKGGYTRYYHVILSHPEHGLIVSTDCEDQATKIAKLLDDGIRIQDAVEVQGLRPSTKIEGQMVFDAVARTASQAKSAMKSASVESAIDHCWEALKLLPEDAAKKVLAALKVRLAQSSATNLTAAPAGTP